MKTTNANYVEMIGFISNAEIYSTSVSLLGCCIVVVVIVVVVEVALLLLEEGINFGRVFIPNLCCGGSGA